VDGTNNRSVTMPAGLAQSIADYLQTKPFREVAPLLMAMERHVKSVEVTDDSQSK
jgi:hypothetical protein